MISRALSGTVLFLAIVFFLIATQSFHAFALLGANPNVYIAALPSLAFMLLTFRAYVFAALFGVVLLKAIPAFEVSSLVLLVIAGAIFFAVRFSPLHPFVTNIVLVATASAAFYLAIDPRFLGSSLYLVELFLTLGAGAVFALLSWYARE